MQSSNRERRANVELMPWHSTISMKENLGYIFVDDGYPEAFDYDNNFVCYDLAVPGSYERALAKANLVKVPVPNRPKLNCHDEEN